MKNIKIVFLGADRVGKTTLIEYTKKKIEAENNTVISFFLGWKKFHNPILRLFSKIHMSRKNKKIEEKSRLARYKSRSWFFYLVYYFELWIRYVKILNSKAQYILIDRYFYDELVFSKGLKFKLFKLITPKPDICFILKAPLNEFKKRGSIESEADIEKFYKTLSKTSSLCKTVELDSSISVKRIYNKLRKELIYLPCR
ncbi:MAG: hypothetical protein Q7S27_06730 [Nanoarchaeota archaeon]|nr:hypothetical protein [Nanoarchaeota archaeon]